MKALLRENLIVVISVALPLVVLAGFGAAALIPMWRVGAPEYDVILTNELRVASAGIAVNVIDERVRVRVTASRRFGQRSMPRLFVFDTQTRALDEIPINMPSDVSTLRLGDELPIPRLADVRVDPSWNSADGWRYEQPTRTRSTTIFTGLFGNSGRGSVGRLVKDGAVIALPGEDSPYSDRRYRFHGWIVE